MEQTMSDFYEHHLMGFPGRTIELAWLSTDPSFERSDRALVSLFAAFEPCFLPTMVSTTWIAWVSEDESPIELSQSLWGLFTEQSANEKDLIFPSSADIEMTNVILPSSIESLVSTVRTKLRSSGEQAVDWQEVLVPATEARIEEDLANAAPILVLREGVHQSYVPIFARDGKKWAGGPSSSVERAPVTVSVGNHYGALSATFSLHWSLWESGTPGAAMWRDCQERALAHGWRVRTPL
jgi:hypothetical protein